MTYIYFLYPHDNRMTTKQMETTEIKLKYYTRLPATGLPETSERYCTGLPKTSERYCTGLPETSERYVIFFLLSVTRNV
jgi:hypothetical protein